MLNSVIIEPNKPATHSVIWLHGLGADGHDFESIVPELNIVETCNARFIFPHAPMRPVTLNAGMTMRAWYDITGLQLIDREDYAGMLASAKEIEALIDNEIAQGIPSKNIILAGFSQGGAMALFVGLRYRLQLAGILALSCYVPARERLAQEINAANLTTPIFMMHGLYDMIVARAWGELSMQYLKNLNMLVSWQTYPMEHAVCHQQIQDIGKWMKDLFK